MNISLVSHSSLITIKVSDLIQNQFIDFLATVEFLLKLELEFIDDGLKLGLP